MSNSERALRQAEIMKKQADDVYNAVQKIATLLAPIEEKAEALQALADQQGIPVHINVSWYIEELNGTGGNIFQNWDNSNCY